MFTELTFLITTILSFVYFGWFGLIVLVTSVFLLSYRYGVFSPIHLYRSDFPESHLLYIEYEGDYYADCPKAFNKICSEFKSYSSVNRHCFAAYYDDPENTPKGKCRFVVGMLKENNSFSDNEVKEKTSRGYIEKRMGFECVKCVLPNFNHISMIISYKNYYDGFFKDLSGVFKRFDIPEKPLWFFVEVYKGSDIEFVFPIGNDDASFYLHSDVRRKKEEQIN